MQEQITPEMIKAVQKAVKSAEYNFSELVIDIRGGGVSPCSVTQALFPEIIDLALELLARKASISLVEFMIPEPKTSNIEYKDGEFKLKNKPLPLFDWNLVK